MTRVLAPLTQPLWAMVDEARELRHQQQRQHEVAVEIARDQYALMERLLSQYVAEGPNTTSTLDERLFKEEELWEPVTDNVFEGLEG